MSQSERSALRVRCGQSRLSDTSAAAADFAEQIDQPDIGLVVVFAASSHSPDIFAKTLGGHFPSVTIMGCSTAGEIGPDGYSDGGISGFSIHRDDLLFEAGVCEPLSRMDSRAGQVFSHALRQRLLARLPRMSIENSFALMLVDGLSGREEGVARAFHDGLGGTRLVGGSAGDGMSFSRTFLFMNGRVVNDAALLLVAWTPYPFEVFKSQHFVAGRDRLVVTGAVPSTRAVTEINGCPAAEEYAQAVGVPFDALDPMVFAANPVVVQIGNKDFVRSIRRANPDGSLTFFCAIDEGIVFRIAERQGIKEHLVDTVNALRNKIGEPSFILTCDCILRRIEMQKSGMLKDVSDYLRTLNAVGFSTYGEQYCGLHINQTLTGVAFGERVAS